jgi:hypothetical protein
MISFHARVILKICAICVSGWLKKLLSMMTIRIQTDY